MKKLYTITFALLFSGLTGNLLVGMEQSQSNNSTDSKSLAYILEPELFKDGLKMGYDLGTNHFKKAVITSFVIGVGAGTAITYAYMKNKK